MNSLRNCLLTMLITLPLLTGCSLTGGGLEESSLAIKSSATKSGERYDVKQISSNPNVYRYSQADKKDDDFFLTAISECGYPEDSDVSAKVRQLFVGLEQISFKYQESRAIASEKLRATVSVLQATLDDNPLLITNYSFFEDSCIFDLVIWSYLSQELDGKKVEMNLAEYDLLFEELFPTLSRRRT